MTDRNSNKGRLAAAILLGGLIAGTVDVGAAALIFHASPALILRTIATGLIGKAAAASGGMEIVALGLGLQWAMSLVIAAIYDLAVLVLPILARRWIPGGLAYGVGVFIVMTYVVVPLSLAASKHPMSVKSIVENLGAMLLFGLIIAFFARSLARAPAATVPATA